MKKYNLSNKKNGNLVLSLIIYDKKLEKKLLRQLNKFKCYLNINEVKENA